MINKIFDSTRTQTFSDCPKKYEWEYLTNGTGIVTREKNEHLLLGIGVADASEGLIAGQSLNEVLPKLEFHTRQIPGETGDGLPKSDEFTRLGMGLLYAFELYLPTFREKYNILSTELELVIPLRHDIVWLARPDIVVERKSDGSKFNVNVKTTGRPDKLFVYYEYTIQSQMEAYSVSKHLQSVVSGTILLGLNKGSEREHRRLSPFTYVYAKNEPGRGRLINYGYKAGYTRIPTWTNNVPLPPPDVALAAVQETATIPLRQAMVEAIEDDLKFISEQTHFPMNRSNCNNDGGYGGLCPYIKLCHEGEKWEENLDLYQIREPNHPIEKTLLGN